MKKWFQHNRGLIISFAITIVVAIWIYGCESQVRSIVNPDRKVTRSQLQIEVKDFLKQSELKFTDLDRQNEIKRLIFETAISYGSGRPINPIGILLTLGNILGIGAVIDNQRKDVHIKTLKTNNKNNSS